MKATVNDKDFEGTMEEFLLWLKELENESNSE
jgi:hypothetical protein